MLPMRVIVEFVFVLVRINVVVFPILKVTIPEKLCPMYSLFSCLNGCHSGLRLNKCCSIVIVLVNVCFLYLVEGVFHQLFHFLEMLVECMNFRHYNFCITQLG